MSAYAIAKQTLAAALAEATETDIDEELLLRALLGSLCEAYRERMGPEDLKAILQFQLDNAQGDEDYAFMRP